MANGEFDWLRGTYWFVPEEFLTAILAVNGSQPQVREVTDQTVWFFQYSLGGYLIGTSATNVGHGWGYSLVVGSVAPGGAVKLSFAPLGGTGPGAAPPTIGDGTLIDDADGPGFLMQMTSGTTDVSLTHWATMRQVLPDDPAWASLPGYPGTGVASLTTLQTPIEFAD
jgi:hypothetical protein